MRAARRTLEEQRQLVTACRESGLSDREWCMREGISPATFQSWVRRLKKLSGVESIPIATPLRAAETHDIVQIGIIQEVPDEPRAIAGIQQTVDDNVQSVMELISGQLRIRLTNSVDPELLGRMIQLLR